MNVRLRRLDPRRFFDKARRRPTPQPPPRSDTRDPENSEAPPHTGPTDPGKFGSSARTPDRAEADNVALPPLDRQSPVSGPRPTAAPIPETEFTHVLAELPPAPIAEQVIELGRAEPEPAPCAAPDRPGPAAQPHRRPSRRNVATAQRPVSPTDGAHALEQRASFEHPDLPFNPKRVLDARAQVHLDVLPMPTTRRELRNVRARLRQFADYVSRYGDHSDRANIEDVIFLAELLLDYADEATTEEIELARGAIEYVLSIDDGITDVGDRFGLLDDLKVLRTVADRLGLES